ncbi:MULTISPECIES: ribosome hibernation-promoting factor, HPF/YfiA family [unclassified Halanaerobium]|uniref:ribosome hibernation-promoting factor, HPF/YfiA family n=1 Tax=unclassified Halanaerobium TaxID=2641197 RepID=UPI000DF308F2|nr:MULTISPECIES: ribosome-associated translation inhibitor RaiA [unclassified Halanaerobium]RCW43814.1 putative sigma-54 modulation protein [Halanaerobium sp. MA284_MarDTE_T2]RCW80515.1 putative sigma-54 modulation protein [Halanaerobium sp. DL-01]
MKIMTYGKNIDVTPSLKEHAEEKVRKLDKYFNGEPMEVQISMEVERERHIVEVTAYVKGLILRGEEATGDMYASIDGVVDKLERQLRKYKTKIHDRYIERKQEFKEEYKEERKEQILNNKLEEEEIETDVFEPKIVRTKQFAMKPMNVEEACMQMDLLGHDFFVFYNAETEETNVVYKRKDGNYGLIEPIFG